MHRSTKVAVLAIAGVVLILLMIIRTRTSIAASTISAVPPCTEDCTVISISTVTTKKGGILYEMPKEYVKHFDQSNWQPEPNHWEMQLQAKWPSMAPFTMQELDGLFKEWDKIDRDPAAPNFLVDLVTITLREHGVTPTPISAEDLEAAVIRRFGKPVAISAIPMLQEYPENFRNSAYRPISANYYLSDGMPAYIFCSGKPLSRPGADAATGGCLIQMTWPTGFEVDIKFNRKHLASWLTIHERSAELMRSFAISKALPVGSLLKGRKSNTTPNPSFEPTAPGVPASAAQLKR